MGAFKTYNSKDGLNSNSIVSIASGSEGEIYAATYENGINIIKNGKIENWLKYPSGNSFQSLTSTFWRINRGRESFFLIKIQAPILK